MPSGSPDPEETVITTVTSTSTTSVISSPPTEVEAETKSNTSRGINGFDHPEEKVIREDVLQCLSRKHKYYRLVLTSSEILLQLHSGGGNGGKNLPPNIERYSIQDLFGVHTLRHKQNGPSFVAAYICFYIYPKRKRVLMSKTKLREKVPLVFEIRKKGNGYEENLEIATRWKEDAIGLIQGRYPKWNRGSSKVTVQDNQVDKAMEENGGGVGDVVLQKLALSNYLSFVKRYLVIINPVSGQGKGVQLFNERVHPILMEAGVKVELLITEHAGHAKSVVNLSQSLLELDGIITVGGDGLLYEVVNGLRSRQDLDKISKIPLGAIASGSGNGLARSIAGYSKEDQDYLKNPVLTTSLAAARGKVVPVNLMEVEMDGVKSFGFLSVGWGLMSDIDVESEVLRAIGEPRFTLWAFLRLAKLRSYRAQLSYIPCERVPSLVGGGGAGGKRSREPVNLESDFISVYSTCQSFIGTDMIFAPGAEAGDGLIHLTYFTKDAGRAAATQFLLGIDKGSHLNVNGVTYVTVQEFSIRSPGGFQGTVTVDGESVKCEEIRVKISPQPLYVFAL